MERGVCDLRRGAPAAIFDLGAVPSNGICEYVTPIPGGWIPGDRIPFQAMVGPVRGENSTLTNLMILELE